MNSFILGELIGSLSVGVLIPVIMMIFLKKGKIASVIVSLFFTGMAIYNCIVALYLNGDVEAFRIINAICCVICTTSLFIWYVSKVMKDKELSQADIEIKNLEEEKERIKQERIKTLQNEIDELKKK